ncbi:MAG: DUF3322 domain-containing protein [Gammaproteobacteria bacterium]
MKSARGLTTERTAAPRRVGGGWTSPEDLRALLARLWQRGDLLRPLLGDDTTFPLRLSLKTPASADLTTRFEAVRRWVAALMTVPQLRIEWHDVRHRVQGLQRLPRQAWVDTLDDALDWLGKRREAARFGEVIALTRAACPALETWLARRPLRALELADDWPRLLAVVRWMVEHPRPGLYLRQVDVPGVHSKFIEAHRPVLAELLDLTLPVDAIATAETGATRFAARYGFRDKPTGVRFRVLDERLCLMPGASSPDVTLDAVSFARLELPLRHVFITENETNFLAFPAAPAAIVIFGAGYGWSALGRAAWLMRCPTHYWGDIDTHGFAILDGLRAHFPHVFSFLMDRDTLLAHEDHWGEESAPIKHDLPRLTALERALFDDLRENRIRERLRLEQEKIGFQRVVSRVIEVTGLGAR